MQIDLEPKAIREIGRKMPRGSRYDVWQPPFVNTYRPVTRAIIERYGVAEMGSGINGSGISPGALALALIVVCPLVYGAVHALVGPPIDNLIAAAFHSEVAAESVPAGSSTAAAAPAFR